MKLCNIYVEDEWPTHLCGLKMYVQEVCESELHATGHYLRYEDGKLTLYYHQELGQLALTLDFDAELRKLDSQVLGLKSDPLKRLLRTKVKSEMPSSIVEIGTGAGKDTMHFLALGLSVISYERHPLMYYLCLDALRRAKDPRLSKLQLNFGPIDESLLRDAWVFFDPMFEHDKNRSAKSPKAMQIFQSLALPADGATIFAAIKGASPKKIIVKRSRKQKSFTPPNPSYSLEGRSISYDVYSF